MHATVFAPGKASHLAVLLAVCWLPGPLEAQTPVLSPEQKTMVVGRLLKEAQTYREQGHDSLAAERYGAVLSLDPDNRNALSGEAATRTTPTWLGNDGSTPQSEGASRPGAGSALRHPLNTWFLPVPRSGRPSRRVSRQVRVRTVPQESAVVAEETRRLQMIVIPHLDWHSATFGDALDDLRERARTLGPEHYSFSVMIKLPDANERRPLDLSGLPVLPALNGARGDATPVSETRLNLTLNNLSILEALRELAAQVGMKVKVTDFAVEMVPILEETEALSTEELTVDPRIFGTALVPPSNDPRDSTAVSRFDAKAFLEAKGIPFPPGSSAVYLPRGSRLVARNTAKNLDRIEGVFPPEDTRK